MLLTGNVDKRIENVEIKNELFNWVNECAQRLNIQRQKLNSRIFSYFAKKNCPICEANVEDYVKRLMYKIKKK